jgi:catechol 2,3-dioxygenase-like lactoylglutathione lyase family enzyme
MGLIGYYRDFQQLGYVTRDLDEATAFFQKKLGCGPFALAEHALTADFGGRPRELAMRVALGVVGGRQIEIIQPLSGAVEFYRDGIDYDRHVAILHHVAFVVPGPVAAWNRMVDEVRAGGDDFTVMFASDENPDFQVRFGYVDTRAYYGHFTEYLWWSAGAEAFNAMLPPLA